MANDGTIITWDLSTGRPLNYADLTRLSVTACASADGLRVLLCDGTGRFRLWEMR